MEPPLITRSASLLSFKGESKEIHLPPSSLNPDVGMQWTNEGGIGRAEHAYAQGMCRTTWLLNDASVIFSNKILILYTLA